MRWNITEPRDWERIASFCGRFKVDLNQYGQCVCMDEGGECPFDDKNCLMIKLFDLLDGNLDLEDLEIIHSLPIEKVVDDSNPNVRDIIEIVKGWEECVGDEDRDEVS